MKTLTITMLRKCSFSFLLLIFIIGCSKKDQDFRSENPSAAFPALATFDKLDVRLQKIVRALDSKPSISAKFSALINDRAIEWSKSLISLRNKTLVALIPLRAATDKRYSAFVAIELDSILRFRLFDSDSFSTYESKKKEGDPTLFDVNHALNALNSYGLGSTIYSTAGLQTAELRKLDNYKRNSVPEPKQLVRSSTITITTCYSWSACTGDGNGNCVGEIYYFTECVSEVIWFKSFDDGFDMGGGYGYEPGGGESGGYHNPNIPSSGEALKDVQVLPPSAPIADINNYLACFDTSLPAKVTIYADQPIEGTTEPISILGGIGHAYMSFEQSVNGMMVRRTVGFYNATKVDPFYNKSAPGVLGNDSTHDYNVKWETSITPKQLDDMIQATVNHAPVYNIESYNCANFVLDVASAGGINLPRSVGWWYVGSGLNPGALGEDLRKQPGAVSGKGHTEDNVGECQ